MHVQCEFNWIEFERSKSNQQCARCSGNCLQQSQGKVLDCKKTFFPVWQTTKIATLRNFLQSQLKILFGFHLCKVNLNYYFMHPRCKIHINKQCAFRFSVSSLLMLGFIYCCTTKTSTSTTTIINNIQEEFVQLSAIPFSVSTLHPIHFT